MTWGGMVRAARPTMLHPISFPSVDEGIFPSFHQVDIESRCKWMRMVILFIAPDNTGAASGQRIFYYSRYVYTLTHSHIHKL